MANSKLVSAMGHNTARVVRELRDRILRGELAPGAALRQEDLARQLGVSRVPLREALLVLTSNGLLVHRPNQGFLVAERSRSELSQVHLILSLLEDELTRTLEWPGDAGLAELLSYLRNLNSQMAALVDHADWLDMVRLNHAFHHAIWRLSPLKLVIGEVDRVWALADAYIASDYSSRSGRAHTVEQHDRIIAGLASRDAAQLEESISDHRDRTAAGVGAGMLTVLP
jgi:DNA-binding GntR family transcriptional regulator